MTYEEMIAAKLPMLETLVRDLFTDRFLATNDPVASAESYAENRKRRSPNALPEPYEDSETVRQEVWNAFLDQLVAQVRQGVAQRDR